MATPGFIDVCTINQGTKFYDEKGVDIIPIRMITVIPNGQNDKFFRIGEVSLNARNKNILPPWDPAWNRGKNSPKPTQNTQQEHNKIVLNQRSCHRYMVFVTDAM